MSPKDPFELLKALRAEEMKRLEALQAARRALWEETRAHYEGDGRETRSLREIAAAMDVAHNTVRDWIRNGRR